MKLFPTILLSILLTSCYAHQTYRPVYLPEAGHKIHGVKKGYKVVIYVKDETKYSFLVTGVDVFGLHGSQGSFAYHDIKRIVVTEEQRIILPAPSNLVF